MGLDRNKHDSSLQIWDMNYHDDSHETINPMFSYCTNESIVPLKFPQRYQCIGCKYEILKEIDVRSPTQFINIRHD
nr:CBM_HP1_G0001070.mRNA.1.CDS.1 [Saccharomyces cerevisiae]